MDHTHIVNDSDLEKYADTRASEGVIPELVYLLVKQSVSQISVCRIPYGDAVNQPGWDGLVETQDDFLEFVPKGVSYWEIGTPADPQTKATEEFRKRTKRISESNRNGSSFIFVTPRSRGSGGWNEPKQTAWLNRRKNRGWKDIRIIDGVKLADWLREFPALGRWMAKKIGLSPTLGGLSTPAEHWEMIQASATSADPSLPPKIFIVGRDNACNALQALFQGQSNKLILFAESPRDVDDFVAAYLATLDDDTAQSFANRCLYISDEDAWRSVVESKKSHVFVADPDLCLESENADLQTLATSKGHAVIIPICAAWSGHNPEIIKLRSPTQSQLETAFLDEQYSLVRARELASIGGDRLSVLRRYFQGLEAIPPYASWDNARLLAQAGLAGKWNEKSEADRAALEKLLGKEYGEWIESLISDTLRSDTPLIQRDGKWRLVARGESWNALGPRLTDGDLDRLQETAIMVLGERDPKFDLPEEERFAASIHGKQLQHSEILREGLAETLALVGSRPEALSSCSHDKAETIAALTVRSLLENATWDRWASLGRLLPLLAESSPNEFLGAVESGLENLKETPFHQVFAQESSGGIGGSNYISGLLWALETLAWHPDFLASVIRILGDLASIDPGGNWLNRPAKSLVDILLPWNVQTCASMEKRKVAVETLLAERPEVAWKLLLGLLPHNHGSTMGCRRPVWRNYIPRDWEDSVAISEYWDQVTIYTDIAVDFAKTSLEKFGELLDRLSDLPEPSHNIILDYLASEKISGLPEEKRFPVWQTLCDLVRKHRKFADAQWAMPEELVKKIEIVANVLVPDNPELRYHHLFHSAGYDVYDEGSYEEQQERLSQARQDALQLILERGGVNAVMRFAQKVAAPYQVGHELGNVSTNSIESELLPVLLETNDEILKKFIEGYVWSRFRKLSWTWVDQVLANDWSMTRKTAFLVLLPFAGDVWSRVGEHLGQSNRRLYWSKVGVAPCETERDSTFAVEKLIEYGRASAAVHCVYFAVRNNGHFDPKLATRLLTAILETENAVDQLDYYETVEVIKWLQERPDINEDVLFKIEWNFLPLLDQLSLGSPKTLENRLASDPSFFAEIIALVFRSKNQEHNGEEPTEHQRQVALNAYRLLNEWRQCPGMSANGDFDPNSFSNWLTEAKRITKANGYFEVACSRIGHMLTHAPADPCVLWIHPVVAEALDARDASRMREGFRIETFNQRGVHGFSAGKEELELARLNRGKAEALEAKGYSRFATAMRELAERYERDAKHEASRDPFEG